MKRSQQKCPLWHSAYITLWGRLSSAAGKGRLAEQTQAERSHFVRGAGVGGEGAAQNKAKQNEPEQNEPNLAKRNPVGRKKSKDPMIPALEREAIQLVPEAVRMV